MAALRNAALVVLGTVLGLLCLEGALRATAWSFRRMRQAPAVVATDGTIRVLCLGESTTFDMDFRGAESYPAQLQRLLNAQPGPRFVVINGGVPATTTDAIVHDLPATLDRERPDIVVTMMGINDTLTHDPMFQVRREPGGLHLWRLARLLYATLRAAPLVTSPEFPTNTGALPLAWTATLTGHPAEAHAALAPLVEQVDWPRLQLRALGVEAVTYWYEGKTADATARHAAFLALDRAHAGGATAANYQRLQALLRARRIPLVAVQYPTLPVASLEAMLDPDVAAVVDNEEAFLAPHRRGQSARIYRDLFAGLFGHLTPHGNTLLAERVANGVRQVVPAEGHLSAPSGQTSHEQFQAPVSPPNRMAK